MDLPLGTRLVADVYNLQLGWVKWDGAKEWEHGVDGRSWSADPASKPSSRIQMS
jgi:hypothetical protein